MNYLALQFQQPPIGNFFLADVEAGEPADKCVTWGTISVPDSELYTVEQTKQLTIKVPLNVDCAVSDNYSFTIWLDAPDRPEYQLIFKDTIKKKDLNSRPAGAWSYIWTVPSDLELDVNQGYQITFTVGPGQTKVATSSVFFLRPGTTTASSTSGSIAQTPRTSASNTRDTTLSTSTLPAPSTINTALPPGSIPNSASSAIHNSGLSKGVSAGVAIGVAAFLALVILGGRRLYRLFRERPKGKQRAESPMLFWTGRRSANNVSDGREQQPVSPRDTLDGRTIVHLGPQHPGVHQLGGVELQPMSDKAAAVLGLEEEGGPSQVRSGIETGKPARISRSPPPYSSPSPSSLPSYSTQPPRPPRSNVAFGSPEPSA
ncbi:hypothetical protein VMCG_10677 [Cytospora schulzeri]|uniref:Uncharacterized protein n=1 Tax=Cytospora schulzeri TaxID=448051 RepID=A0A423VAT1_9PEZI|nr:hypothetical protein VMCG_10677 [Valsa malicola]